MAAENGFKPKAKTKSLVRACGQLVVKVDMY